MLLVLLKGWYPLADGRLDRVFDVHMVVCFGGSGKLRALLALLALLVYREGGKITGRWRRGRRMWIHDEEDEVNSLTVVWKVESVVADKRRGWLLKNEEVGC